MNRRVLRGQQETSFRYLFEKNPNPMWVFDRETLFVLEVNDAAVEHYGYTHDEFRRLRITDLRPADDVSRLLSYLQSRPSGFKESGEWRHVTKDGRTIDVEVTSYTLDFRRRSAVLVVVRDITESKRAEQALRDSEAVARGVLDTALDAYLRMDEGGRITEWNAMAEETFGWTRSEAIGRLVADTIIPPDQREAHRQGLARFLATGEGPVLNRRVELQALHRSGAEFLVEATIIVLDTDRGRVFSGFFRDLREKKLAEAQLRQAQRMEAVGHLAGGIAHDFNNLLTVVIGTSDIALERMPADDPLRPRIEQIRAAGDRASGLTRQLLAFSRQQVLQPEILDLNAVVERTGSMLRRLIGEDIDLHTKLEPDLDLVEFDPSQIEQIIVNLAINARDAMPRGGKLTLETENVELGARYVAEHPEAQPGPHVMIAMTDTGHGMDAETRARIFEPFFTTKEVGRGTGLGLSTVYGIVKQSGGNIWVYSEPGRGTTFKVYLPRAERESAPARPQVEQRAPPKGSETILVVEDEADVRAVLRDILEMGGYTVLDTGDAEQAIEICKRHPGDIHLLLTDVVMPKMGGPELAETLRALRPDLRVAFMSGYTDNAIVHHGVLKSGIAFLNKPIEVKTLLRKIPEFLGQSGEP